MLKPFPHFTQRRVTCLDGLWDFAFIEDCPDPAAIAVARLDYRDRLPVPGVFDTLPDYAARRGTACYRTAVTTSEPYARLLIRSGGLGMWGALYWDGRLVGVQDLPYSAMDFTLDGGPGTEHELVVAIDNRFDFSRQPLLSQNYDYYCHGGIFRSIELHELPEVAIDSLTVRTLSLEKGTVQATLKLIGQRLPATVVVTGQFDGDREFTRGLALDGDTATFEATLDDRTPWSPETPRLHTLTLATGDDAITVRFGLRTIEARDGQLLLNGRPQKLRGYCRHESHPEFGPALPLQIVLEDVQLLRQTGCNFVRGSHYPQDPRFLDLCDEMGIMVWEETVGWGDGEQHLASPAFREAQLRQPAWLVRKSANHPCVIMWGFLNEGDSTLPVAHDLYAAMAAELRRLDPTRPITFASNRCERDVCLDLADIISINIYPGWYAADQEKFRPLDEIRPRIRRFIDWLHQQGADHKPLIISEIGAGAIYGWRDRFRAHWSEEYQADFLDEVCTVFAETPRLNGIALWQFIDCRTYSSARALGRPRAFNNKGLFDEYRRPKLAFDIVSRHFRALAARPTASDDASIPTDDGNAANAD